MFSHGSGTLRSRAAVRASTVTSSSPMVAGAPMGAPRHPVAIDDMESPPLASAVKESRRDIMSFAFSSAGSMLLDGGPIA